MGSSIAGSGYGQPASLLRCGLHYSRRCPVGPPPGPSFFPTGAPSRLANMDPRAILLTFAGDPDTTWDAMIQDVDDVTFDNISLLGASVGGPCCFYDGSGSVAPSGNTGAACIGSPSGASFNLTIGLELVWAP